jgi:hypothetical protein
MSIKSGLKKYTGVNLEEIEDSGERKSAEAYRRLCEYTQVIGQAERESSKEKGKVPSD